MGDFFLNKENTIERLHNEWEEHGSLIIAYDFDDTVYDLYDRGFSCNQVIELLKRCKKCEAKFIVFTCRGEEEKPAMVEYLTENDIPFDAINENIEGINFSGRKIYYNVLLDDRAGLQSAYECLLKTVELIERRREWNPYEK